MHAVLKKFWLNEEANASGAAYLLVVAIVAIGSIVGLVHVRDAIVFSFADVAGAMNHLDQSYTTASFGGFEDAPPSNTPLVVTLPGNGE